MNSILKEKIKHNIKRSLRTIKWIIFAIIVGVLVGLCGTLFYFGLSFVTLLREQNTWLIFLLPIGGLIIVGLYKLLRNYHNPGTNLVILAVRSDEKLPFFMAPLIFISTLITHLCGGSAGREGAALQIGGSLGGSIGKLFRFDSKDNQVMIMCGMSAAFSAVFGTPMAAAIFSLEMVTVGVMYYSALLPCVLSSLIAHAVATAFGVGSEQFSLGDLPVLSISSATKVSLLAALCALISILFCILLHQTERLYEKYLKNPYIRIAIGGCIIILLTLLIKDQTYNGAGMHIIEECFNGNSSPEMFIIKMIFTALTLGAGYKGGEIVPSFFVGATFGCLFGNLFGFSPALCTAIGMTSVFCGVTNCPITSLLISFELFGYNGMPYFLLAIAFSYMLSGYSGLYHAQKIAYSKYRTNYINKSTK